MKNNPINKGKESPVVDNYKLTEPLFCISFLIFIGFVIGCLSSVIVSWDNFKECDCIDHANLTFAEATSYPINFSENQFCVCSSSGFFEFCCDSEEDFEIYANDTFVMEYLKYDCNTGEMIVK